MASAKPYHIRVRTLKRKAGRRILIRQEIGQGINDENGTRSVYWIRSLISANIKETFLLVSPLTYSKPDDCWEEQFEHKPRCYWYC